LRIRIIIRVIILALELYTLSFGYTLYFIVMFLAIIRYWVVAIRLYDLRMPFYYIFMNALLLYIVNAVLLYIHEWFIIYKYDGLSYINMMVYHI